MTSIRRNIPTALETEYKAQIKLSSRSSMTANTIPPGTSHILPEDVVSLSSAAPDQGNHPAKLRPSLPVSYPEKQYLRNQFSTYA